MSDKISPRNPDGIRKVHVGCGPHAIMKDWWNIDIRKFPGIDEAVDATEPWPYKDLQFVFAEHFIEHLPLMGGLRFLLNAGNSLRPGGVIRLSTPNLEWVIHTHFQTGQVELERRLMDTLRTNRAFHGWGHHFLYSEEILVHFLEKLGYTSITACRYGESAHRELNNLEKHGKFSVEGGFPSVVIVEGTRGDLPLELSSELEGYLHENYLRYVAAGH